MATTSSLTIVPDGPFLRKYIRLLEDVIEYFHDPTKGLSSIRLILLESAAEMMDWRNTSPSIIIPQPTTIDGNNTLQKEKKEDDDDDDDEEEEEEEDNTKVVESASTNERSRIIRLVEENVGIVIPFADLSYRGENDDDDDDEFDFMGYENMSVDLRSRLALGRAGRLLLLEQHGSAKTTKKDVIILSEDELVRADNIGTDTNNNNSEGIVVMDCPDWISFLHSKEFIDVKTKENFMDTKVRCEEEYDRRNSPPADSASISGSAAGHAPYWTEAQIKSSLSSGTLHRGKLDVTKINPHEGYVTITSPNDRTKTKYYINDELGHFNRTLHDDNVIIQPLPKEEWGRPVGRRRLVHGPPTTAGGTTTAADDEGRRHNNPDTDQQEREEVLGVPTVPSARVVALSPSSSSSPSSHNNHRRQYIATLPPASYRPDDTSIIVVPMDVRVPKIRIKTRIGLDTIKNKRLLVEIDGWELGSNYPHGHYVKVIGDIGDLETEISCLLIEHHINLIPFSASALACLPTVPWSIPQKEIETRKDLRQTHRIFSVDPPGCQDIDDTMHAKVLPNGDVEVGVHIADVTHFVQQDTALDREALIRGTTFYLVDRRFDMLPSLLSSDLCSLHGHTDRLAVSVIWTMSSDFTTVKSCWYGKTIIHNCQAMTYDQANNILNDEPPDDITKPSPPPPLTAGGPVDPQNISSLKNDLIILTNLARKLRHDREEIGGAVDLSSSSGNDVDRGGSELKFTLDRDGNPTKVIPKVEKEIHHTIAEMMILANEYVAKKIYDRFPSTSLLRIHRTVEGDRFEELEKALKAGGMKLDGSSNRALALTLKNAREGKGGKKMGGGGVVDTLFQSLATRAMSEAQYICTGDQEPGVGLTHYGLGIDKYTHFTSPIRRYADIVVHRLLLSSLLLEQTTETTAVPSSSVYRSQDDSHNVVVEVPESNAISVLRGDGLVDDDTDERDDDNDEDDLLDSLIEGASELALGKNKSVTDDDVHPKKGNDFRTTTQVNDGPYETGQVSSICETINYQNRMAKLSSMDCQRLFLSLYFRDHIEVASAVIIGLKLNGLLVYVPRFDLKGPVFLSDREGNVQIDPEILGLSSQDGLPPSSGFAAIKGCRKFPNGETVLTDEGEDDSAKATTLQLNVPGRKRDCIFRALDVVTVQLSCDTSETVARVPPPRLHLIAKGQTKRGERHARTPTKVTSELMKQQQTESSTPRGTGHERGQRPAPVSLNNDDATNAIPSMFDVLSSIKIQPKLDGVPLRFNHREKVTKASYRVQTMPGRIVFGNFRNPDTHRASQEAAAATAAADAAAQRRRVALSESRGVNDRRNEYDTSRRVEREVTSRMQRLAAEKRHARRAKAK